MSKEPVKPKWDPSLEPLMKHALSGKHGMKHKPAVEVGKRAVTYLRGLEFVEWVKKHGETLKKKFPDAVQGLELGPDAAKEAEELGNRLIQKGFIIRAMYKPIDESKTTESNKRPKWPKRLAVTENQKFTEDQFYIIAYEGDQTISYALLSAIIGGVLLCVMFPAWPLSCKIAVWYLSVFLLSALLGLTVIRLVVFVLVWFCGVDFWIFPNMFDDNLGVIDSFKPLYSWVKRDDDWKMMAARVFCAIMLTGAIYQLSLTHSLSDVRDFARDSFMDLLEWGEKKLAAIPEPAQRYPSLEQLQQDHDEKEEGGSDGEGEDGDAGVPVEPVEDFSCLKSCEFDVPDFDALKAECISDCSCAMDLMKLKCFKECDEGLRQKIALQKDEACSNERAEEL
uniref:Translocation protein SEC62 n=1 Tax=Chromera velia CCMP2878 TaxID=1169474 RepID=A0A0G4GS06_9ALVE|mmetsp:Transcript_18638/g.37720  ORF Transcript_18638/g.37720 Transcript_18638/m.37720 type:complete len:394 (-) Transcript_18638:737-1918(-)|eukprot:Cvel_5128.t1-p1 / transcript=Cvel_5128.t1 / gene=Cvel_5128 / organism=Chromera_velia_CCMP2878 / gene_product=Translocation protein sec62, putative / transcript_product=Translocation protein sec62, putative / location=Cvel_scaffold234:99095-104684(-) / protein_length=393 / sequence_SO=supercontig / SO=protein_coding / is_pseudo=false